MLFIFSARSEESNKYAVDCRTQMIHFFKCVWKTKLSTWIKMNYINTCVFALNNGAALVLDLHPLLYGISSWRAEMFYEPVFFLITSDMMTEGRMMMLMLQSNHSRKLHLSVSSEKQSDVVSVCIPTRSIRCLLLRMSSETVSELFHTVKRIQ